jgi:hypothetical protein
MLSHRFKYSPKTKFWFHHKTKIASVLFAIFVWFLIVADGIFDHTIHFPVRLPTHPEYMITSPPPADINVRIEGTGFNLLSTVLFNEGHYVPSISWIPGETLVSPVPRDIVLEGNSKRLKITQILQPNSLKLYIERIVDKIVPVKRNFILKPAMGYTLVNNPVIFPDSIHIKGPESTIMNIDSIGTVFSQFETLKSPLTKELDLEIPNKKMVRADKNKIRLSADIQKIMERQISNITIRVENSPYNMRPIVLPARINLQIQGGVEIISPLTADSFDVYLDYLFPLQESDHNYQPIIKPKPWVRISSYNPERFKIVLEKD